MALAETADLVARLTLKDEISSKIAGIERRFGGMGSRIGSEVQRGVKNAASNIAGLSVVAGAAIATQVAVGVKTLAELERIENLTKGVIESTGGAAGVTAEEVRKLAVDIETLTTASDRAVQEGANMLLTFTNIGRDVFPDATKAVVDMGIAMADGDVEAANFTQTAIQVGKALNDPIRGIGALRRVGVQFTKQQEDQIKVLVESGKTQEAQVLILKELERQFGKAGEAAGQGFGADIRRAQDAIDDAQQALAVGFLPVISKVATILRERLADPKTIEAIKEFGTTAARGLSQLIDAAGKIPWAQIGDAMRLVGTGAKAALDFFTGLPPWVQTAVLTGWGLNKLTGGALGNIVGELGKGLIKGVLGMTAGVVNIAAANVNTTGGGTDLLAGGGKGLLRRIVETVALVAIPSLIAVGLHSFTDTFNQALKDAGQKVEFSAPGGGPFGIGSSIDNLTKAVQLLLGGGFKPPPGAPGERQPGEDAAPALIAGIRKAGEDGYNLLAPQFASVRKAGEDGHAKTVSAIESLKNTGKDTTDETKNAARKNTEENRTSLSSFRATERATQLTTQLERHALIENRTNTNSIVAAIERMRPPQTLVTVNVSANSVTRQTVVQQRSGVPQGSRYGLD